MRFFCTQPDIVEDARNVRYQPKSKSSKPLPSISKHHSNVGSMGQAPAIVPLPDTNAATVNRSRTNLAHNVLSGGKKFFHTHSHTSSSTEQRKLSIGAPTLITAPSSVTSASVNILGASNTTNMASAPVLTTAELAPKPTQKPKSYDGAGRISMENKALTDTEGLGGRRKSRRLSTPFVAALKFGTGNEEGFVSGNESGKEGKTKRRVSKLAIGAPEGFRHEGHMGLGETFGTVPQDRDTWNVESWRAEIERTMKHNSAPTMARPKGPRPASIEPPARRRGSVDGAAPRWSADRERSEVARWSPEKEKEAPRWSNERERDGAVSDYPIGRPLTAPTRSNTNASSREGRHSRSRSGSQTQTGPTTARDGNQMMSRSGTVEFGQSGLQGFVQGHVPGKDSITSLASTPTTVTTLSSNTIITPTTTMTSLSRSLSEKPYYSHHTHHQASHSLGDGVVTYGKGLANSSLQRASSANATVGATYPQYPPNLPPSSNTSTATSASHASSTTTATRKPIPHQRRKPVPQHLPTTVEVSPFPSVLIPKDGTTPTSPTFPFDINPSVERAFHDANANNGAWEERMKSWREGTGVPAKVKKELVPLLGVPTDGAHYVTKSTKARWDGAMAEIASALKDPDATPTPA